MKFTDEELSRILGEVARIQSRRWGLGPGFEPCAFCRVEDVIESFDHDGYPCRPCRQGPDGVLRKLAKAGLA